MERQFSSMGEVLMYLKKSNITDLEQRAEYIQGFIDRENQETGYDYNRYVEYGAANLANVVTEHSRAKKECLMWCVNHYLSLNRNRRVMEKTTEALRQYGTGCGTSASSCGMSSLHKQAERKLAQMVGKETAVLFPTGFTANVAGISGIAGSNDLILFDRECHSSIINGLKLSAAKWISFKHNNVGDLELKLAKYRNQYQHFLVIVEGAYSMSGDLAPLKAIVALKQSHHFYLYVDEAHTFGIYGPQGQGYCYEQGVSSAVDFIMATLSKATASIGGFVAAQGKYCSVLRWADPYVFQACIPPADVAVILACLEEIEQHPDMLRELHEKNRYMRELLTAKGFNLGQSQSPIIPIFIEDYHKLRLVVRELYEEGIYSTPICFPAVKVNEGRIRLILNLAHTREQLERTAEALERTCQRHQVIGAEQDSLTGLYNRKYLLDKLENACEHALRRNHPLALAVVAIDRFAAIREQFSEQIGEQVLVEIAGFLKASLRSNDIVSRYGENQFALVFVKANALDIQALCDRLRAEIAGRDWTKTAIGLTVTASFGVTDMQEYSTGAAMLERVLAMLGETGPQQQAG